MSNFERIGEFFENDSLFFGNDSFLPAAQSARRLMLEKWYFTSDLTYQLAGAGDFGNRSEVDSHPGKPPTVSKSQPGIRRSGISPATAATTPLTSVGNIVGTEGVSFG